MHRLVQLLAPDAFATGQFGISGSEFPHDRHIGEDGDGFLKGFQIFDGDQYRRRSTMNSDCDPVVLSTDAGNQLREMGLHLGQRACFWHSHKYDHSAALRPPPAALRLPDQGPRRHPPEHHVLVDLV